MDSDYLEKTNDPKRKIFHRICIVILTVLFAVLVAAVLQNNDADEAALLHTAACGIIMVMDILLAVSYSAGHYAVTVVQDRIYMLLLILISAGLLTIGIYRLVFFNLGYYYLEVILSQVSLILTSVWIMLFGFFDLTFFRISKERQAKIRTVIIVFSITFIALVITNPLTGFFFGHAGAAGISPGPLFFLSWVFSLGFSLWYSVMILRFVDDKMTKIALLIFEIHTPLWFVLDLFIGFQRKDYGSFIFLEPFVSFLSMFVIFCFIYIENNRKLRENEMLLTQSRLNSLQMQMDPHFMANALNALSVLTDTDPAAAKRMISDLSGYLRENFYDPDGKESLMIPFPKELKRLELYLAIERIRFPEIRVNYWLETTDFDIPAMTLQPLVENAIKHGICKKRRCEGSIEIRSSGNEEAYSVIVEDDGAGFDERHLSAGQNYNGNRKHIGIPNTRKRLELMCGGTLSIHSTPGSGTVCEITIPKRKNTGGNKARNAGIMCR